MSYFIKRIPCKRQLVPSRRVLQYYSRHVSNSTTIKSSQSKLKKFNDRLPPYLQKFTSPLLSSPVSHITAFLVLHEITSVIPLFGLATFFHYSDWIPESLVESYKEDLTSAMRKYSRYFQKKGWISEDSDLPDPKQDISIEQLGAKGENWKWITDIAAAYIIVKLLLPPRLILSAWMSPWFARIIIIPVTRLFRG